jgi:hypothetical protein
MIKMDELTNPMSYADYRKLLDELMAQNKTTGNDQSPAMIDYARLNIHRMNRVEKTMKIDDALKNKIESLKKNYWFVILTEGWCGDAAQNVPAIVKLAGLNPRLKPILILRDENPAIMDRFLTNGSRSIPKLIITEAESGKIIHVWGPRPKIAQDMVLEIKKNPAISHEEMAEKIHAWYAKDKTLTLQGEFSTLMDELLQHESIA